MAGAHTVSATVRPVLIESAVHTLLLIESTAPDGRSLWRAPTIGVPSDETYAESAMHFLHGRLHLPPLRISPVVGCVRPHPYAKASQYILLVRAAAEPWPASVRRTVAIGAQWWAYETLRSRGGLLIDPPQLLLLLDGYWNGWLPDGEITLD